MKRNIQVGTRARFKSLMDETRFTYPRQRRKLSTETKYGTKRTRSTLTHPASWYLDGHLETRPITMAYAYAVFAEHMYAMAKKRNVALAEAADLFADTRRFMEFIRCNFRARARVRGKKAEGMRPRMQRMTEKAKDVWAKLHVPRKSPLTPTSEL